MTYQDDLTFDEISENDGYMVEHAIKNASRFTFLDVNEARHFAGQAVKKTMDRLNILIKPGTSPRFVDKHMVQKGVKVEAREKYKGKESWKCGIYIYQDDELVAFVSSVFHDEANPFLMNDQKDKFYVITNARLK